MNGDDVSSMDRIPPNALESEAYVLGAAIIDRDAFDVATILVNPTDFYSTLHEAIWLAIVALYSAGARHVDKVGVAEELRRRGMLEKIGGVSALTAVLGIVVTTSTVEYHARIVSEKASLRRLIHAGTRITAIGYEGEWDAQAALVDAEQELAKAALGAAPAVVESVFEVADRLNDQHRTKDYEPAFYGPWAQLNRRLGGFMPGELIGWVAAPQVGKSGVVSMLADYTAERYGAVILAAYENRVPRTVQRLLALRTGISARAQRIGNLSSEDRQRLIVAARVYRDRPFYVVDREAQSLAGLWRVCRTVAREHKIATVIIDHASKLDDVNQERGRLSKHERLSSAYERLIMLGAEFGCAVHVVQHFNRDGASTGEPNLSSLSKIRDGGNLEGHADAIIMPHRVNPLGTTEERETGKFIIAKSRDGDGGAIDMRYVGHRNMWIESCESGPWFQPGMISPTRDTDDLGEAASLFGDPS